MVVALQDDGSVLLERRPESGVWGGLWCLPEFATATAAGAFLRTALRAAAIKPQPLSDIQHAFTPSISRSPRSWCACAGAWAVREEGAQLSLWYNIREPARIGVPAPITTLLSSLASESLFDARSA